MRTMIFIPAFNEQGSVGQVVQDVKKQIPEADVVVISDGSTDQTALEAGAAGALVVDLEENEGLRYVIARGYKYAKDNRYDICGRVDGDGQHPPQELAKLIEKVREGACDVAFGSRFVDDHEYKNSYTPSWDRKIGTTLLKQLIAVRFGRPLADATSGMYAVNKKAMDLLADAYTCGAPELEGLLRCIAEDLEILEVPVEMKAREQGESKIQGKHAWHLVATVGMILICGKGYLRLRKGK